MEYQQRLRKRRRGVLADRASRTSARACGARRQSTGARALGQPAGAIAVGARADWLVLDPEHASMAGAAPRRRSITCFSPAASAAIRDVMVAGRWVVKDGRHAAEASAPRAFREPWIAQARARP